MPKPTVAISVDCICAKQGKCYVSGIVSVAEQFNVPLTWLLGVAEHDPLSNVKLYHNEYLHRIPAWHELGLHLTFDTSANNTIERGDLIRIGKDILKQNSIKPTAFRADNGDLEASDLRALEDIGILVDSTPGSSAGRPLGAPKSPYHPSYDNVHQAGEAKIWIVPVANVGGARGYLDDGFDKVKPVIDASLAESSVLSLALRDCQDNTDNLRHVVDYLKKQGEPPRHKGTKRDRRSATDQADRMASVMRKEEIFSRPSDRCSTMDGFPGFSWCLGGEISLISLLSSVSLCL